MIENIYSNTAGKEEEYQASGRKPPKNVRQAGYFTGDLRIYVEDYVHTFTHWLAEQDYSKRCVAVLVGEFAKSEHTRDVYAYGTVVIEGACTDDGIEMTSEIWTQIYETIKNYFPEGEIVGWFYGGTSFTEEEKEMLSQVHLDYFAGTDRILMLYDFLDREEEFYRYEGEGLVRQSGYYIYYEKNTEMQNYMIDKKQGKNVHEEIEDRAVKEIRARLNVNAPTQPKKETESQAEGQDGEAEQAESGGSKLLYTAGIVVAAVAVITGASMIYNQERMKGFEQTLNQIISAVRRDGEETPNQNGDTDNNDEKNGNTQTADGNHGSIFDDPKAQETFQNGNQQGNGKDPSSGNSTENPSSGNPSKDGENNVEQSDSDSKAEEGDKESTGETDHPAGTQGEDAAGNPAGTQGKDATGNPAGTGTQGEDATGNQAGTQNPDGAGTSAENEKGDGTEKGDSSDDEQNSAGNTAKAGDGTVETSKGADGFLDTSNYTVYTVQPGDTLVGICMRIYGSIEKLDYIKALNQINNENLIYAYQELLLP